MPLKVASPISCIKHRGIGSQKSLSDIPRKSGRKTDFVESEVVEAIGQSRPQPLRPGPSVPSSSSEPGSLVTIANNFSASAERREKGRKRRSERFELRRNLWEVTSLRRVRCCGRVRQKGVDRIRFDRVLLPDGEYTSSVSGLQTCGSVWCCPVCAAKIRAERAAEIDRACIAHLEAGGGLEMGVLTFPHDFGDALNAMWEVLSVAFSRVIGGRGWRQDKERFGIVGFIRVSEGTHGKNGWHPHAHYLLFTECPLLQEERLALQKRLFERFKRCVVDRGYRTPFETYNQLQPVRLPSEVADYLCKAGLVETDAGTRRAGNELARFDLKEGREKGRTPFQILKSFFETGDLSELELWREWERGSKGKQSISWSKGLKARLEVSERKDEDIAAEEVEGVHVEQVFLSDAEWRLVCRVPGALAKARDVMEDHGSEALRAFIASLSRAGANVGEVPDTG